MPIYKQTTEITNIDDLLSSVERDIEEVYFGDKNVFTVWGEYDGALPAQYSANGDYLADYRIYGSAGGVGDEVPNLWNEELEQGVFTNVAAEGTIYENMKRSSSTRVRTKNLVEINGNCTLSVNEPYRLFICFFDENMRYKTSASYAPGYIGWLANPAVFPYGDIVGVPKYIAVAVSRIGDGNILPTDDIHIVLNAGSTPIPYGYEVDMSVSDGTTSTTTPIYIGSSPLNAYEYIDYASGKIYRWSSNQLSVPEVREKVNEEVTCTVSNDGVYTLTVSDTVQSDRYFSFRYNPVEIPNGKTWTVATVAENILSNNGMITLGDEIHPVISVYIQNNGYNTTRPFGPLGTTYILDRMSICVRAGTPAGTFTLRPMLMYIEPTDPPVPLPALPTVDGTTITNYAGQSAAPTEFYAKYRKQNF